MSPRESMVAPFELVEDAAAGEGKEGVEAPNLLHEPVEVRIVFSEPRTALRVLVQRQGGKRDVPRHGHGRPDHVQQLDARNLRVQQAAVRTSMEGDGLRRTPARRAQTARAQLAHDLLKPTLSPHA